MSLVEKRFYEGSLRVIYTGMCQEWDIWQLVCSNEEQNIISNSESVEQSLNCHQLLKRAKIM